jgi:hypothetical protein
MAAAVPIIMGIIGGASSYLQIQQNQKVGKDSIRSTIQDALRGYQAVDQAESQVRSQAQLDRFERRRQAAREESKLRVASGDAGILGGVSPARNIVNAWQQSGFDVGIISTNENNQVNQLELQKLEIQANAQSRINEAKYLMGTRLSNSLSIVQGAINGVTGSMGK